MRATTAPRHWTPEEDEKLTRAATNNTKTKHDKEYRIDWVAVATLVPGQTLHSGIDPTLARTGRWTTDEDTKLTDAVRISVRTFRSKNWLAISALVPGRTSNQCRGRWHSALADRISRTTAAEDKQLKDAETASGGKNLKAIAALVPGRTTAELRKRWYDYSVSDIEAVATRAG
jgi:hypothetical protein